MLNFNTNQLFFKISIFFAVLHLTNKSLPWEYNFTFVVEEISNINDKDQVSTRALKKEIHYISTNF